MNTHNIEGVTTHKFGDENEPVSVIDDFSGGLEAIIEAGLQVQYSEAAVGYPGLRAPANPNYLKLRDATMFEIFKTVFGLTKHIVCDQASYSLVTTPRSKLTPHQRIPHVDDVSPNIIAIMHYLRGPETGGTAFYKHRRTGFETITADRYQAYQDALRKDDEDFGPPSPGYILGDTKRYEMIGKIEAKPDRLILYRGHLLHSGYIPNTLKLSSDPAKGRLTVNMFLTGH